MEEWTTIITYSYCIRCTGFKNATTQLKSLTKKRDFKVISISIKSFKNYIKFHKTYILLRTMNYFVNKINIAAKLRSE